VAVKDSGAGDAAEIHDEKIGGGDGLDAYEAICVLVLEAGRQGGGSGDGEGVGCGRKSFAGFCRCRGGTVER